MKVWYLSELDSTTILGVMRVPLHWAEYSHGTILSMLSSEYHGVFALPVHIIVTSSASTLPTGYGSIFLKINHNCHVEGDTLIGVRVTLYLLRFNTDWWGVKLGVICVDDMRLDVWKWWDWWCWWIDWRRGCPYSRWIFDPIITFIITPWRIV